MTAEAIHKVDQFLAIVFSLAFLSVSLVGAELLSTLLIAISWTVTIWRCFVAGVNLQTISKHGYYLCGENIDQNAGGGNVWRFTLLQPFSALVLLFSMMWALTGNSFYAASILVTLVPVLNSITALAVYRRMSDGVE